MPLFIRGQLFKPIIPPEQLFQAILRDRLAVWHVRVLEMLVTTARPGTKEKSTPLLPVAVPSSEKSAFLLTVASPPTNRLLPVEESYSSNLSRDDKEACEKFSGFYSDQLNQEQIVSQLREMVLKYLHEKHYEQIIEALGIQDSSDAETVARKFVAERLEQLCLTILQKAASEKDVIENNYLHIVKEQLHNLIQTVPTIESLDPEERARFARNVTDADNYNPQQVHGVMERGYVVTGSTDPKLMDEYTYVGTDKLHSCVSPVICGRTKLTVAHFDNSTEASSMQRLFAEFRADEPLQIFLFGGIPISGGLSDAHNISVNASLNIYFWLYKLANEKNVEVNIVTANTFAKTQDYRQHHVSKEQDETIGFVIGRDQKFLLFPYPELGKDTWLPYTNVPNAGLFKGLSKRNVIWFDMLKAADLVQFDIFKVYDGTNPEGNRNFIQDLNHRCLDAIINKLVTSLAAKNLASDIRGDDNALRAYLSHLLNNRPVEDIPSEFRACPFIYHLQTYFTYNTYLMADSHHLNFPISEEARKSAAYMQQNSIINGLLISPHLENWCKEHAHEQIANYICKGEERSNLFRDLISTLPRINSTLLLNELNNYKNCLKSGIGTPQDNLILMLSNDALEQPVATIIESWQAKRVKNYIVKNIIPKIWERLDAQRDDEMDNVIKENIVRSFERYHPQLFDAMNRGVDFSPVRDQIAQRIAEILNSNRPGLLDCCKPTKPPVNLQAINSAIEAWAKTNLPDIKTTRSLDSPTILNEKEKEKDRDPNDKRGGPGRSAFSL